MPKVRVELELEIPSGILFFDLGILKLCCKVCGTQTPVDLQNVGLPSQVRTLFINTHAPCVVRHNEEQRRRSDAINATRGGPDDR